MSEAPVKITVTDAIESHTNESLNESQAQQDTAKSSANDPQQPSSASTSGSGPSGRRRIKASRACDQCRKRKIKCDYNDEKGICTNCSKNGEKCTFDRVPLKRGPSKGYTRSDSRSRSTSFSNDTNNTNTKSANNVIKYNQDFASPSSRTSSILLPPLAQYLPQSGGSVNPNGSNNPPLGQQQFWKVPYHEFSNTRRGSIDSLQSDLSMKSLNATQDQQLLYATPNGSTSQGFQSPSTMHNGAISNNPNAANEQSTGYWSFMNRTNHTQPSFAEDADEVRRKSSSFPPILRNAAGASITNHPQHQPTQQQTQQQPQTQQAQQVLYPYSQFSQQRPTVNPSLSSFGQFGVNGYQSRHGSIASEGMSPSAPMIYQSSSMTANASNTNSNASVNNEKVSKPLQQQQSQSQPPIQQRQTQPLSAGASRKNSDSSKTTGTKKRKRAPTHRKTKSSNSNISMRSNGSSHTSDNSGSDIVNMNNAIIYGQISDVDLIDTYYEFIHTGFPIIPLNKQTLTNEILLVNTQPISAIHEVNNYVITWFRNSLELLVRISLKKRYNYFFDGGGNISITPNSEQVGSNADNGNSSNDNTANSNNTNDHNDNKNNNNNMNRVDDETLVIKTVFIGALNECLQKIVDVHPRFREIKAQISPKIKIIYLSTFILLNYILAVVGYDNSFVLGMSVTIFKEFRIHELLLFDNDEIDRENDLAAHSIIFKRLYVLLIIFDSLQSCLYGGPKLINIPIQGSTEKYFQPTSSEVDNWVVDESPNRLKCILQSIKLGELISEIAMNRRSICDYKYEKLIWEPNSTFKVSKSDDEMVTTTALFHDIVVIKIKLTNALLTLESKISIISQIAELLCELISKVLNLLTSIIKLNPTNRIDYNFRPIEDPHSPQEENCVSPRSSAGPNVNGNEIYQKLLGLQQDKKSGQSNLMRGIVSPYCVAMVDETSNVLELIKQLPTSLIGLIVQNTLDLNDSIKPQELVVQLSNSMNEIVTITSLLNMIKPLKLLDQQDCTGNNERPWKHRKTKSVMERLYRPPATVSQGNVTPGGGAGAASLQSFTRVGWQLLDDSELGWC